MVLVATKLLLKEDVLLLACLRTRLLAIDVP